MLPRFPDESDPLPQFDLEASDEIRPSAREIPPPPMVTSEPSIIPVALEPSDPEQPRRGETFDLEDTIRTRVQRKAPRRATLTFVAVGGAIAAFGLAVLLSAPGDTGALSASLATMHVEVGEEPAAAPPPPAPTTGTLVAPAWTKGRRVWVDGKPLEGHAPKLVAPCGNHQVKVGANGKTRTVDIPCGGEIKVAP